MVRGDLAAAVELLAADPPDSVKDAGLRARLLADRAYAPTPNQVDPSTLFDRACNLAQSPNADAASLAQALTFRGIYRTEHEQFDPAEADLRSGLAAATRAGDEFLAASAKGNLARLFIRKQQFEEALHWATEALQTMQHHGYEGLIPAVLNNIGWCYFRLADFDKAEDNLMDAQRRAQLLAKPEDDLLWGSIGGVQYARGNFDAAVKSYRKALEISRHSGSKNSATWLSDLATCYLEMGKPGLASTLNQEATGLLANDHSTSVRVWPLLNSARIAMVRRDFREAQRIYDKALAMDTDDVAQRWEIRSGLGDLYLATHRDVRALTEYEEAVKIIDASWSSLVNDHSKLTFPTRAQGFYDRYVGLLMKTGRSPEALDFVESHHARLLAEKTGGGDDISLPVLSEKRKEVLMSYWLGPERSYVWTIAPGKAVRFDKLAPQQQICAVVADYAKTILDDADSKNLSRLQAPGQALYKLLVAPVQDALPGNARITVVPDGCLNGVNLETLIRPDGRFWVEEAAIEVAPSLRLLDTNQETPPARDSILLIGDPTPGLDLPQLPFARQEIHDIMELYPNHVVRKGSEARPEAYKQANPDRFPLIHFATHALPNLSSPLDSSIVLSQGRLYAGEIQHVKLSHALVTISACRSAGAKTYAGEGLVGFAWAFLGAGASGVIGSLWDANDRSTAPFMKAFYSRLRQNKPPAVALHETKLEFLANPAFHEPYYWAPFQIYVR